MLSLIFLLIAIICLLLLILFLLGRLSDHRYADAENRQIHRLLEEQFLLQEKSLETYREMLDVACREKGFWESGNGEE